MECKFECQGVCVLLQWLDIGEKCFTLIGSIGFLLVFLVFESEICSLDRENGVCIYHFIFYGLLEYSVQKAFPIAELSACDVSAACSMIEQIVNLDWTDSVHEHSSQRLLGVDASPVAHIRFDCLRRYLAYFNSLKNPAVELLLHSLTKVIVTKLLN